MTKKELEDKLYKSLTFNQELKQIISDQQLEIAELRIDMQDWFDGLEECEDTGDLSNFCLNLREYLINKLSIKHK
tara:strand:- start:310 stop:534 length:225 start_codon:yes stop_codon:yes gene_type:complete